MLAIGTPDLEHAVDQQRHANHGDEQSYIFEKEAATDLAPRRHAGLVLGRVRHSITSSARVSIAAGTVTPSTFAVWRLITNSNFVGCWTGRSAGFAPFRILST